jgi:hypothetical protein
MAAIRTPAYEFKNLDDVTSSFDASKPFVKWNQVTGKFEGAAVDLSGYMPLTGGAINGQLNVTNNDPVKKALVIKAADGQAQPLLELQDSAGNTYAYIDSRFAARFSQLSLSDKANYKTSIYAYDGSLTVGIWSTAPESSIKFTGLDGEGRWTSHGITIKYGWEWDYTASAYRVMYGQYNNGPVSGVLMYASTDGLLAIGHEQPLARLHAITTDPGVPASICQALPGQIALVAQTRDPVGNIVGGQDVSGYYYIGNSSTDGCWRIATSGTGLVFERRESGTWVTKQTVAA